MRYFILLVVVFWPLFGQAEEAQRQIVVNAVGSASAAPDMAMVRLGVTHEARTAAEAMRGASEVTAVVLANIAEAGIEDRDVQTSSLNLSPVWDRGNTSVPQIRGYVVSTQLAVRVRALDTLGQFLDLVISDGANTLNGLSFAITDPAPLEDTARAEAVRLARAKAETLATAAGVTLGPVLSIREGGGSAGPQPLMRGAMMDAAAVPVATGELDIRVGVTLVFAIED